MEKKEIRIGDTASFSKTISEHDVYTFAGITGDFNTVHINKQEAEKSVFKHRIAHGMLTGSLISAVLGSKLPGEGTVYLEQDLKFKAPVYFGDTCTAHVEVVEILKPEKGIYKLNTWITNQNDEIVSEGYAVVKY
jgi:3-hydroxybutyryl-CoA dehydratase